MVATGAVCCMYVCTATFAGKFPGIADIFSKHVTLIFGLSYHLNTHSHTPKSKCSSRCNIMS